MKRIIFILMIFLIVLIGPSCNKTSNRFAGQTLTIYNVEDYISNGEDGCADIIKNFEEEYGVKVNYYTYDTNETMYNQFSLQKEGTYDLICTSDYMIQKMIKKGLVEKIDSSKIPNYEKFAAKVLRDKLKQMEVENEYKEVVNLDEYAVGYMWGTLGIVYDANCSDTIRNDVLSWDVFWDENYKNLISIKNSIRDAFVCGLMHSYSKSDDFIKIKNDYLFNPTVSNKAKYNKLIQDIFDFKLDGQVSSDEENKEKIANVKKELIDMKKNIFGFEVDSGKNDIITGKIKLNLAYSGDAVYSISTAKQDRGITLEYCVPVDGSNIWYDAWTMPKGAKNVELAYEFLNYLSDPDNACDNMDYIGYTPYIVGDSIFTYVSSLYGASDFDKNIEYSFDEEEECGSLVVYENVLYECIKSTTSSEQILPTNEEYFTSLEFEEGTICFEEDMLSYNGKIYTCVNETTKSPIEDPESFVESTGYDLSYLFEGTLTNSSRKPIIYANEYYYNQLKTQYPDQLTIARCAVMNDFDDYNDQVVIMWGQVKAYSNMTFVYLFLIIFVSIVISIFVYVFVKKYNNNKIKKTKI